MAFRMGVAALAVLVSACGGSTPQEQVADMGLPAWGGEHIVCNEDVSFAAENARELPSFEDSERLGFCARSMRYIELHRLYSEQTSYFGVVAANTASLAATYAPLVRRAYSEDTWAFLAELNKAGEAAVIAAATTAQNSGAGGFFSSILGGQLNTAELIRTEQDAVQRALDALEAENPEAYAKLIAEVNETLNPTNRLLIAAINRNPFFKAYEAGLAKIRLRHGGAIDYAEPSQRVEVSEVLEALISGIAPAG